VRDAAPEEASAPVSERGLPPLPHTAPPTLRRTYISVALLARRRERQRLGDSTMPADRLRAERPVIDELLDVEQFSPRRMS
jgi:hypothetical protein